MKTIRIYVDSSVVIFASVADKVHANELITALNRVVDRFACIRESKPLDNVSHVNMWSNFLEAFCTENKIELSALLSKRRNRPLPRMRAIVLATWQEVTNEQLIYTSARLGLHHSSMIAAIDTLSHEEIHNRELRKLHFRAIEILKGLFDAEYGQVPTETLTK